MLARLRIGTRSGQPSKAACGRQADELGLGHGRVALDGLEQRRQGQRLVVLDVARDLGHVAARGEGQADGAQARQPRRAALADGARDGPRVVSGRLRAELEVEGDERRAGGDEHRARGRVHAVGAEVGAQAVGHPLREARRPALAQLGARAPVGQQAVEEDGQAELAEGVAQRERLGQRGAALLRACGRRRARRRWRRRAGEALRGA